MYDYVSKAVWRSESHWEGASSDPRFFEGTSIVLIIMPRLGGATPPSPLKKVPMALVTFHFHFNLTNANCKTLEYLYQRCGFLKKSSIIHSSPRRLAEEKKSHSYNHKTAIWVSHEYYLNPEFHKILWRAFWIIAILRFSPYVARVDFKGLISK